MECTICAWSADNLEYRFLHETQYWRAILAPNQSLAGRCVLHLKRHTGDLAGLTRDELIDWRGFVSSLQSALPAAFGAAMFNWSCYMNHAYRKTPYNPHVHWWVVPRYNHTVKIKHCTFDDPLFGDPYDHHQWIQVPDNFHQEIADRIRCEFSR